jgi:hypothetical protein
MYGAVDRDLGSHLRENLNFYTSFFTFTAVKTSNLTRHFSQSQPWKSQMLHVILHNHRRENLTSYTSFCKSPPRKPQILHVILHSHRRENLKSYTSFFIVTAVKISHFIYSCWSINYLVNLWHSVPGSRYQHLWLWLNIWRCMNGHATDYRHCSMCAGN